MASRDVAPESFWRRLISFSKNPSTKAGNVRSRSVCPVGAVSTMTRSKRGRPDAERDVREQEVFKGKG
jgi:hypothetical protein